jgi:fructosamine-3-kinase
MLEGKKAIDNILSACLGIDPDQLNVRLVAAGSVNQGIFVGSSKGDFFLKTNFEPSPDFFRGEAEGLRLLKDNTSLQVPEVLAYGREDEQNYLLLAWIDFGQNDPSYWQNLGEGMAELHMATQKQFGLNHDNFISSLPQKNTFSNDWTEFFITHRLDPLISRAYYEEKIDTSFFSKFRSIYPKLEGMFPREKPALLHGDLWSGNVISDASGNPVLVDPAVYYGHREMDIAFSKLFGGFDKRFYETYESVFPLEPEFADREAIYNLYPLLVHLILFGSSYLPPIERTVRRLVG